ADDEDGHYRLQITGFKPQVSRLQVPVGRRLAAYARFLVQIPSTKRPRLSTLSGSNSSLIRRISSRPGGGAPQCGASAIVVAIHWIAGNAAHSPASSSAMTGRSRA